MEQAANLTVVDVDRPDRKTRRNHDKKPARRLRQSTSRAPTVPRMAPRDPDGESVLGGADRVSSAREGSLVVRELCVGRVRDLRRAALRRHDRDLVPANQWWDDIAPSWRPHTREQNEEILIRLDVTDAFGGSRDDRHLHQPDRSRS